MSKRVVITGMSGITSLGNSWEAIRDKMSSQKSGITIMEDWKNLNGLHTHLGGPITDFKLPEHYTRKQTRAMGRVAKLSVCATEAALNDAKLLDQKEYLANGKVGIAYGSCSGTPSALADLSALLWESSAKKITATTYVQAMSHTCAVNIALFFGIKGRIITTTSACTSSSQAIGYAYEAIKNGYQEVMLAGGAEELCASQAAVFDTLYATSQKNETPELTPRPFDKDRDGLVIGEGACTIVLEELEHAKARGATIYAEVAGFATNCDAQHITQPSPNQMGVVMQMALKDASISADQIGYISAHGTATEVGDIAESQAVSKVLGNNVPISSLKGYFGHTLGACGSLEAWLSIQMMRQNAFVPTLNLDNIDPRCARLDYIQGEDRSIDCNYIMSNNFAFGGINTSLIFKKSA